MKYLVFFSGRFLNRERIFLAACMILAFVGAMGLAFISAMFPDEKPRNMIEQATKPVPGHFFMMRDTVEIRINDIRYFSPPPEMNIK